MASERAGKGTSPIMVTILLVALAVAASVLLYESLAV